MSTITAPSYPPYPFFIGKGVQGANGVSFNIFGQPLPNYLTQDFANSGIKPAYSAINGTTLFDVSSLTENHEVVVVGFNSQTTISSYTQYTFTWYRSRDNAVVFVYSSSITPPSPNQYSNSAWIGWLAEDVAIASYPQYREIQENGNYYVVVSASGGETFSQTINFAVTGIPAQTVLRYPTSSGFEYTVRTTNYFDTSNYIRVGIATSPVSNGSSSPPSGILSSIYPASSSVGCAAVGTAAGLNASQQYTLYGFAQAANGLYYSAGSFTNTTLAGAPPVPPYPVDFSSRTEGGFDLFWGDSSTSGSGSFYELNYKPSYLSTWQTINTTTNYRSLIGLQYGVTYDFKVRAFTFNGYSAFTSVTSWTTAPKTPSISTGVVTNNSITINAGSMSGNYDEIQVQRYTSGSVYIDEKYCQAGGSVTWNGLPPNTTYIFKARSKFFINSINLYSVSFSNNLTVSTSARPSNWSWFTPKTSGADFDLTAIEWNNFTSKIDSFRAYKGLSNYGFTAAPYGDGQFYAFMFNQARNAIYDMNPPTTVPDPQISRADVYAWLLNGLRDSLNSIV